MKKITFGNLNSMLTRDVIAIIISCVLIAYMVIDLTFIQPKVREKVKKVNSEYVELKTFLDKKIPQIDSTLLDQSKQLDSLIALPKIK